MGLARSGRVIKKKAKLDRAAEIRQASKGNRDSPVWAELFAKSLQVSPSLTIVEAYREQAESITVLGTDKDGPSELRANSKSKIFEKKPWVYSDHRFFSCYISLNNAEQFSSIHTVFSVSDVEMDFKAC